MPSLNELAQECHQVAVDKGFWVHPKSIPELICLMHSELSEACEEYRVGRLPNETYYVDGSKKPEGIPSEIADVKIRILDACGGYLMDLDSTEVPIRYYFGISGSILEDISTIHYHLSQCLDTYYNIIQDEILERKFVMTLNLIDEFCKYYNIDIESIIREKLEYNKTRSYMHGKIA